MENRGANDRDAVTVVPEARIRLLPGQPGNKASPGRPVGSTNKSKQAIIQLARDLTTANPDWVDATKARLVAGTEHPSVVIALLHYAHGKPKENVELAILDKRDEVRSMSNEELIARAAELHRRLAEKVG